MKSVDLFFAILRSQVCGGELTEEVKQALTPERLESVYSLAKEHDLAHIVGQALGKNGLLSKCEVSDQFRRQTMLALMRHTWQENACEKIFQTFEESKIPFIPLKGAVLRAYYPESWMRTSCDIDILVRETDLEDAIKALEEKQDFKQGQKTPHDVSLHAPNGMHLELHYAAVEEKRANNAAAVLDRIWGDARPDKDGSVRCVLSDAMFYFYHIAHMAKHVQEGGCGARSFLDLWILNHRISFDPEKRQALLKEGGLLAFAKAAESLSEVWFSNAEADAVSVQLARFILYGGMYGSMENNVAIKQMRQGGRFGYAMSRIFPSYEKMEFRYPALKKCPLLLPVYHIARWVTVLCKGNGLRSLQELETNASLSGTDIANTADLMKKIEL